MVTNWVARSTLSWKDRFQPLGRSQHTESSQNLHTFSSVDNKRTYKLWNDKQKVESTIYIDNTCHLAEK